METPRCFSCTVYTHSPWASLHVPYQEPTDLENILGLMPRGHRDQPSQRIIYKIISNPATQFKTNRSQNRQPLIGTFTFDPSPGDPSSPTFISRRRVRNASIPGIPARLLPPLRRSIGLAPRRRPVRSPVRLHPILLLPVPRLRHPRALGVLPLAREERREHARDAAVPRRRWRRGLVGRVVLRAAGRAGNHPGAAAVLAAHGEAAEEEEGRADEAQHAGYRYAGDWAAVDAAVPTPPPVKLAGGYRLVEVLNVCVLAKGTRGRSLCDLGGLEGGDLRARRVRRRACRATGALGEE